MKRQLLFQELYMGDKLDKDKMNKRKKINGHIWRTRFENTVLLKICQIELNEIRPLHFWIVFATLEYDMAKFIAWEILFVADTTSLHAPQEMFKCIDSNNLIILKRSNHFYPILFHSQWFVSISM